MKEIKDFIYLDMEKVSSLYSQLSGGVVQSVEASSTSSENNKNLRSYDFKIFRHDAGGTASESQALKEVRVSHHDIYNELESYLFERGYTAEIGVDVSKEAVDSGEATKIFESALCVKVKGNVVLEDYERITRIADNHEDVVGFINNSITSSLLESPALQEVMLKIHTMKDSINKMKNGAEKNNKKKELRDIEENLESLLSAKKVGRVDDWIIDGLKTWVRVFLPDVFNVRVYPFEGSENFHVMSNVKRKFFLDDNTESVHHLFGSKPTIKVTMLGVITSIPQKEGSSFEPMKEFERIDTGEGKNKEESFENGFRGVFRGFDGLEEMIRTCRYPRIMVQPIAIYRAIEPNPALQRARI